MSKFFRVQDAEGRGPYRPGFSRFWSSDEGPIVKPWWAELGLHIETAFRMVPDGMYCGSAFVSLDKLNEWFLPEEQAKLGSFGYYIVRFRADKIIAETATQVVFAQNYPLAGLPFYAPLAQLDGRGSNSAPVGGELSVSWPDSFFHNGVDSRD